ncbi:para-aminobenzoate synthase, (PABA) [Teratosphaeriaceae sp. CCFEE 6253]|nr:para-aminobenzoate synthase, (PABA) [Teratosphaeriaceae sp. CCFEE 6253]
MTGGRILYIDAYDSFSNNIVALLKDSLSVTVDSIKIDDPRFVLNDDAFRDFLNEFDAVVAGPGPGHPANSADTGLIGQLWDIPEAFVLPVLGVCLGFQSFALAFGADIQRLAEPRHGLVRRLTHCGDDVFTGVGQLDATQYHSLHAKLGHDCERDKLVAPWTPSRRCKQVVPLAWDLSDVRNGPILMAARHCHKPYRGVQYHPESVCSSGGVELIRNWWREACTWNAAHSRTRAIAPTLKPVDARHSEGTNGSVQRNHPAVQWRTISHRDPLDIAVILDFLRDSSSGCEPILLESGTRSDGKPVNSETGRFSIIGLPSKDSLQIRWSTNDQLLVIEEACKVVYSKRTLVKDVFTALDTIIHANRAQGGDANIPFWGGLLGFISYEAGLDSISVAPAEHAGSRPDIWFVLVERSVVVDHVAQVTYVQSICGGDEAWLSRTSKSLLELSRQTQTDPSVDVCRHAAHVVTGPQQHAYCEKVSDCQDQLRAGESYELCLTDQTLVRNPTEPWALYRQLRRTNPAPFAAYVRFTSVKDGVGIGIVGSSPERFLTWSRSGKCQFRPIKGTVKKMPGVTRKDAEEVLGSEKERAENLMIVDLIRHDLNGTEVAQNVRVPKLMCVEEYETVFQLVSVIEGDLDATAPHTAALANSLPPGSMTGAPKKRSCELLRAIEGEHKPRGLYSGVLGYLDVGGGGDFSVVIRTAFKWADEDVWRVGAGGAVTALSEPEAEWEEMLAKRQSVLDVLTASP